MSLQQLGDHAATLKYMTYASLGTGSASGVWTWMDDNAGAIGATCSIIGLGMGLVFGCLNYSANRRK